LWQIAQSDIARRPRSQVGSTSGATWRVIFIDLRDREGLTQVVFRPRKTRTDETGASLGYEDVIQVEVRSPRASVRDANPRMPTATSRSSDKLVILKIAPMFCLPVIYGEPANEDLRMSYRYVDLRRPQMSRNLRLRHRVLKAAASRSTSLRRRESRAFSPRDGAPEIPRHLPWPAQIVR